MDGDPAITLDRLSELDLDPAFYHSASGELYAQLGQHSMALAHYDSARAILEDRVKALPGEARFHSELGVVYAGLGRKDDAVREARRAVDSAPIANESFLGIDWVLHLAQVLVMSEEYDAAMDHLRSLLSIPGPISVHWLRLDPIWSPLRDHPGFLALLESSAGKV